MATKIKKEYYRWLLFSGCAIAMLYVRVEYVLLLVMLSWGLVYQVFQAFLTANKQKLVSYASLLFLCILCLTYGNPSFRGEDRSYSAFLAHYAKTLGDMELVVVKGKMPSRISFPVMESIRQKIFNPIFGENYIPLKEQKIIDDPWIAGSHFSAKKFTGTESVFDVFLSYPMDFISHVFRNVFLLSLKVPYSLFPAIPSSRLFFVAILLLLFFLFIFTCSQKLWHFPFSRKWFFSTLSDPKIIFILGIFLSSIISFLVIHPRMAYMVLPIGLVIVLLGRALPDMKSLFPLSKFMIFILCVLTLYFTPFRLTKEIGLSPSLESLRLIKKQNVCSHSNRFHFIRNIAWKANTVIYGAYGDPTIYLDTKDRQFIFVGVPSPGERTNKLLDVLSKNTFDIVAFEDTRVRCHFDKNLYKKCIQKKDIGIAKFIKAVQKRGFIPLYAEECPGQYYLVKKSSIKGLLQNTKTGS